MRGLDLIAAGENLATQVLVVRVRKIDPAKLQKAAVGNKWYGNAIAPALAVVDQFPKTALDMIAPTVQQQLDGYGITADVTVTDAAPPARPAMEPGKILGVGAVLGILIAIGARWIYHRFVKKGA